MENVEAWRPSKYVRRKGRLRATSDRSELSAGSRLVADLVAAEYECALEQHARGRLLDMGCGKVPLFAAYRDRVSEVQCIDWGNSPHQTNHLDKVCDLGGTIPYPDGSFDTIILSDVLEHLPEPASCWREMARLLAPSGKVIMNVPFYYPLHEEPHDFYRYTEFALRRFAEGAGFRIVELKHVGGALEILVDVSAKLLSGAKLGLVAIWMQKLAVRFAKSSPGAKLTAKTGQRFPLSYFMVAQRKAEPIAKAASHAQAS